MFLILIIACFALRYVRTREVMSSYVPLRDLILHILDFPGQLEEYVSHSLFAQDLEALFCVVCDISSPMLTLRRRTSAWLSFIGGILQQKPSVLLAMTHLDKKPASEHDRLILNLSDYVRKNHSNVSVTKCASVNYGADFIVNCLKNIKDLLYNILKTKLKGNFIPRSYVLANTCLQKESMKRNERQGSQVISFAEVQNLLVRRVPEFHDNHQFAVRVLRYLHYTGTILFSQSNKFIVLDPYTWLTNILSLLLPEHGTQPLIPHHRGRMKFMDISKYYKLFRCKRADMHRIMQLLCEYRLCIRDSTPEISDTSYVFPALIPTINMKEFQSYWSVSRRPNEFFVGRVVTCKYPMDSISGGLFCALQVRINNKVLFEHKDTTCVYFRNIILIIQKTGTIQVTLKRRNDTFQANSMEILARGSSPLRLLRDVMGTIRHHLHSFSPKLSVLWSAVCPHCMISAHKQPCKFLMHLERIPRAMNAGVDIPSYCQTCMTHKLSLNSASKYVHRGTPDRALSARQLLHGLMVSDDPRKWGMMITFQHHK